VYTSLRMLVASALIAGVVIAAPFAAAPAKAATCQTFTNDVYGYFGYQGGMGSYRGPLSGTYGNMLYQDHWRLTVHAAQSNGAWSNCGSTQVADITHGFTISPAYTYPYTNYYSSETDIGARVPGVNSDGANVFNLTIEIDLYQSARYNWEIFDGSNVNGTHPAWVCSSGFSSPATYSCGTSWHGVKVG
jgi:hypothetical protein